MTLILTGSPAGTDYQRLCRLLGPYQHRITRVITGDDPGVAPLGYRWAWKHAKTHQRFRAHWQRHGRNAGLVRNWAMAQAGDLLLVLGDATAPRLQHLIQCMATMGKPVVALAHPEV